MNKPIEFLTVLIVIDLLWKAFELVAYGYTIPNCADLLISIAMAIIITYCV